MYDYKSNGELLIKNTLGELKPGLSTTHLIKVLGKQVTEFSWDQPAFLVLPLDLEKNINCTGFVDSPRVNSHIEYFY